MESKANASQAGGVQQVEAPSTPAMSRAESHDFTASSMRSVFIGISGLIGAGKSTLVRAPRLAASHGARPQTYGHTMLASPRAQG